MDDLEAWLAFQQGEIVTRPVLKCVDCGCETDGDIWTDDGEGHWVPICVGCHEEGL